MLTLGIETSCDDSGVALLRDGHEIVCEYLSSQIKDHSKFGGVIPEFAARKHLENLLPLIAAAVKDYKSEINLIAVTRGPGLMGSLMVGVQTAIALSQAWGINLIGVNHIEGHLFAPLIENENLKPPFLSVIISGGHSEVILVKNFGEYEFLGGTRDDAAGEAYDKVAKILGLEYPGGPIIDKLARSGNDKAFNFPVPLKNTNDIEFSFSGLKTAVLWQVKKLVENNSSIPIEDICASFQKAVINSLISKIKLAVKLTGIKNVTISGGVAANSELREKLSAQKNFKIYLPEKSRCTDNAAMIALAGYNAYSRGVRTKNLTADPSLELC